MTQLTQKKLYPSSSQTQSLQGLRAQSKHRREAGNNPIPSITSSSNSSTGRLKAAPSTSNAPGGRLQEARKGQAHHRRVLRME
jgi:hypothetical protein